MSFCRIGFTMSLFVSELAVKPGPALSQPRLGPGRLAAGGASGYLLLRLALPPRADTRR